MKTFLTILCVLAFIAFTPEAHALFGHVRAERQRRQEAEQRVVQEQQNNVQLIDRNQRLHITISILSIGVVTALIIGAAIGSKTRRDHEH